MALFFNQATIEHTKLFNILRRLDPCEITKFQPTAWTGVLYQFLYKRKEERTPQSTWFSGFVWKALQYLRTAVLDGMTKVGLTWSVRCNLRLEVTRQVNRIIRLPVLNNSRSKFRSWNLPGRKERKKERNLVYLKDVKSHVTRFSDQLNSRRTLEGPEEIRDHSRWSDRRLVCVFP